jgi:predicted DNA binding CopG/RHH family protein
MPLAYALSGGIYFAYLHLLDKSFSVRQRLRKGLAMADEQKENKENMIALRLNNEQMLAVKQWAHQHNANVSQVIRSAIELMTGAKQ